VNKNNFMCRSIGSAYTIFMPPPWSIFAVGHKLAVLGRSSSRAKDEIFSRKRKSHAGHFAAT